MSISGKKKYECCGCNACAEICPQGCISIIQDRVGFSYPHVNKDVCVECGLCNKVCPLEKSNNEKNYPLKCYAARRIEPNKQTGSSSGGAATAIGEKIIREGGVVYGCASNGLQVSHIRVDNFDDLLKLQGSKYVQSDTCGIYSQVKADLQDGLKVAFIGTPCQTYGLKKFLRKEYKNLLLVDIICHGTPSQKMLREHAECVSKGKPIDRISFRNGNDFILKLYSGSELLWAANHWKEPTKDYYYHAFEQGLIYRPSCYRCKFAVPERFSDITIGDFWGLKDETLFDNSNNCGTSVILPITKNGEIFVEGLRDEMTVFERNVQEAIDGNTQLRHPIKRQKAVKIFFGLYPWVGFDTALHIVYSICNLVFRAKKLVRNVIRR